LGWLGPVALLLTLSVGTVAAFRGVQRLYCRSRARPPVPGAAAPAELLSEKPSLRVTQTAASETESPEAPMAQVQDGAPARATTAPFSDADALLGLHESARSAEEAVRRAETAAAEANVAVLKARRAVIEANRVLRESSSGDDVAPASYHPQSGWADVAQLPPAGTSEPTASPTAEVLPLPVSEVPPPLQAAPRVAPDREVVGAPSDVAAAVKEPAVPERADTESPRVEESALSAQQAPPREAESGEARKEGTTLGLLISDLRTATPVLVQFLSDVKMLLLSLVSFLYWKVQALWIEFGPQIEVFLFRTANQTRAKASQVQETVQARLREAQVDELIQQKASSMKQWLNDQRKDFAKESAKNK